MITFYCKEYGYPYASSRKRHKLCFILWIIRELSNLVIILLGLIATYWFLFIAGY